MNNRQCAEMFINAIKTIAGKPENMANFEAYLSHHFDTWLEKYANTPEWIAREMHEFSTIEF